MALAKAKTVLKPAFITYVGSEIAKALHYAHTFRGFGGKSHQILHRNVSSAEHPHFYDGDPKLIEFGLRPAKTRKRRAPR